MNALQRLVSVFDRIGESGPEPARVILRRAPVCELLEGRQLLNAAWTPPHGFPGWDGAPGARPGPGAHVHPLDMRGGPRGAQVFELHGGPKGTGGPGFDGHAFTKPSAQLQADFQTLQTDQKSLQAEIPTSLTDAVKADQAVIQKAFSSLTRSQLKALHPDGPHSGAPSGDPTANLAADLTKAGVSSDQANAIVTDFQNLKNALTTTDPSLQAKIAADQAAIAKDGGPTLPDKDHGMGMPGIM
jgi:hypothetical protein